MQISVKYIGHSGFSVQLESHYLLFDYFHGELPGAELAGFKHLDIFSSHSHSDHFNKKIFTLASKNPGTRYFLSDDISAKHENAIYMKPGDIRREKDIEVFAFGSTDLGVSFAIMCEGVTIFHAGDLNLWTWKKESAKSEVNEAYEMYEQEIKKIELQFADFDIAFFPVDPRMRTDYSEGAKIFLERFHVTHFFPMHFGVRFRAAKDFQKNRHGDTIIYAPEKAGQIFKTDI